MFQMKSDIFISFEKAFLHYCRISVCWNEHKSIQDYINRTTASGLWTVIIPLYLVLIRLHLEYNIQFLALQCTENIDRLQ